MRHRWRSPKFCCSRLAILIIVVAGLYLLAAAGSQAYIRFVLVPKINGTAELLEKVRPEVLADLKLLSTNPVYPETTRANNAERFLSGFVAWTGPGVGLIATSEHQRLSHLLGRFERAQDSDESWEKFSSDPELQDIDLAWIDQLIGYDHIDLGTHPAYQHMLAEVARASGAERLMLSAQLPIMDYNELRFAALARVAQLKSSKPDQAGAIYRHVGELIASTDTLSGAIFASHMLQNEKRLLKVGAIKIAPLDDGRIQALVRTAWAWGGVFKALGSRGTLGEFEPFLTRTSNACAASTELLGFKTLMRDYFEPTVFLEYDLRPKLQISQDFRKRMLSVCEHDDLKVFFDPIDRRSLFNLRGRINPERIPFTRRIWAMSLEANSIPNYFRLYEKNPREPASSE